MDQLHKRFTAEQVKVLLKGYVQGSLTRADIQEVLGVGKTRFFALVKQYQEQGESFTLDYHRQTPKHLSVKTEEAIKQALMLEKELVEAPQLPINSYNYSAMRDRLKKTGHQVSATTITKRAKALDCYIPARKHKAHIREVITAAPGALIQHDASTHQWSPYANDYLY
jgi:transposase